MDELMERVAAQARRDRLFEDVDRLLVGCSGGGDSVALVDLLARLAPDFDLQLGVAHLHHGWRGAEADEQQDVAAALAADRELPFFVERVVTGDLPGSREEAARGARLRFFAAVAARWSADAVALGHTADDQLETVVLHLARGTGGRGLGGMRPRVDIDGLTVLRPLLGERRAELRAWARARSLRWGEDSSNRDISLARNRLRRRVLADLQQINPAAADNVARAARLLQDEEEWLDALAAEAALRIAVDEPAAGAVALDVAGLAALPRPLQRRVARHVIESVRPEHKELALEHVEWVLDATAGAARDLPGVRVRREADRVRFLPLSGRRLAQS